MNVTHLDRSFARIGARVRFGDGPINVLRDAEGEFFRLDLATAQAGGYEALDVQPRRRHLILVSTDRFLCGHDERHWFVAGLPERRITTVSQAMDALLPVEARENLLRHKVPSRKRHRRHNPAYLRQGEWFFLPAPEFDTRRPILRDEPLRRGNGKPHMVEELARAGGETVYVSRAFPNGLTASQHEDLRRERPSLFNAQHWRIMARNATVYARGRVRHPDHATLRLDGWHRVALANDVASKALAFLD
jgi:hypothetical protein